MYAIELLDAAARRLEQINQAAREPQGGDGSEAEPVTVNGVQFPPGFSKLIRMIG